MSYVSCNEAVYVDGLLNTECCTMKRPLLEKGLSLRSATASVGGRVCTWLFLC